MTFWSRFLGSSQTPARSAALQRGIDVAELERGTPIYHRYSTRFSHLERSRCVRYSVRRSRPGIPERWVFLQRDDAAGAQYPHGWLYSSAEGPPPPKLDAVLSSIAAEWTEEYLEFEADAESVAAFWEEWGGDEIVAKLDSWLRALDSSCAAA